MKLTLCRGDQCRHHGARKLAAFVQEKLDISWHDTTADGAITLLPADCLSLCKGAPCGNINGHSLVFLTPERLTAALAEHAVKLQQTR